MMKEFTFLQFGLLAQWKCVLKDIELYPGSNLV